VLTARTLTVRLPLPVSVIDGFLVDLIDFVLPAVTVTA
jgi:hypothetical protein